MQTLEDLKEAIRKAKNYEKTDLRIHVALAIIVEKIESLERMIQDLERQI